MNSMFPGLKAVLAWLRQEKRKVTESIFEEAKTATLSKGVIIKWQCHVVIDELGFYLPTKLADKPELLVEPTQLVRRVEMYRVLNQRCDTVGEDTQALLMANITDIGAHQATNIKDLADKLVTLEQQWEFTKLSWDENLTEDCRGQHLRQYSF